MASKQHHYESLVRMYHKELYKFAYWLSGDPTIAEDLVQETFLRAWRALDSLQDENAAKPWLLTILRRENARRLSASNLTMRRLNKIRWSTIPVRLWMMQWSKPLCNDK